MFQYCVDREGLDDYVLYRGDPIIIEEAYRNGRWVEEDLGDVYSGDIKTWMITAQSRKID